MNNDILENSFYMVHVCNSEGVELGPVKLFSLLYLLDASYIAINKMPLFKEEWKSNTMYLITNDLKDRYLSRKSSLVYIDEIERDVAEDLPYANKKYIDYILDTFGKYDAFSLVTIIFSSNSPALIARPKDGAIVRKKKMGEWYKKTFLR